MVQHAQLCSRFIPSRYCSNKQYNHDCIFHVQSPSLLSIMPLKRRKIPHNSESKNCNFNSLTLRSCAAASSTTDSPQLDKVCHSFYFFFSPSSSSSFLTTVISISSQILQGNYNNNDENDGGRRKVPELRTLFRRFWKVAAPYWFSEDKVQARSQLAAVFALTLGTTGISVGFNFLGRDFYNALASELKI